MLSNHVTNIWLLLCTSKTIARGSLREGRRGRRGRRSREGVRAGSAGDFHSASITSLQSPESFLATSAWIICRSSYIKIIRK